MDTLVCAISIDTSTLPSPLLANVSDVVLERITRTANRGTLAQYERVNGRKWWVLSVPAALDPRFVADLMAVHPSVRVSFHPDDPIKSQPAAAH